MSPGPRAPAPGPQGTGGNCRRTHIGWWSLEPFASPAFEQALLLDSWVGDARTAGAELFHGPVDGDLLVSGSVDEHQPGIGKLRQLAYVRASQVNNCHY